MLIWIISHLAHHTHLTHTFQVYHITMRAWNKVMLVLGVLLGLQVTLATASGSPLAGSGRRKRLALGMFGLSTPAPGARGPAARVDYRLSLENYRIKFE